MRPDLGRAREKYSRLAPTYDRDEPQRQRIRRLTVERLALQPGEVVLDVGCGTGLSFPLLEEGVGAHGHIIGIEPSAEMAARAGERVQRHGWQNVALVEAAAEEASLPEPADAVIFHFVHDVTRSEAAIANIFRQLKPGVRVAAAGGKWARWWALPASIYMWNLARRYVTTFEGFGQPWSRLAPFVSDLHVRSLFFGAVYLAWGTATALPATKEAP